MSMVLAYISISLFIQYLPTANLSPGSATLFTEGRGWVWDRESSEKQVLAAMSQSFIDSVPSFPHSWASTLEHAFPMAYLLMFSSVKVKWANWGPRSRVWHWTGNDEDQLWSHELCVCDLHPVHNSIPHSWPFSLFLLLLPSFLPSCFFLTPTPFAPPYQPSISFVSSWAPGKLTGHVSFDVPFPYASKF